MHTHEFYLTSEQAWDGMLKGIEEAKHSIDLEQFIFSNDEIGARFFEALKKKAREGIKIRILADTAGSLSFYGSEIPNELAKEGIAVEFFNHLVPWYPKNISLWYFRDHRKILIIDETIAYVGGVGISTRLKGWRDTHMRIEGPVVEDINHTFNQMWLIQQKPMNKLQARFKSKADIFKNEEGYSYMNTAPLPGKRYLFKTLLRLVRHAKKEILISTPYFVPNYKLLQTLIQASARGVKVKVLVPKNVDHVIVEYAFHSFVKELLKNNIEIWQYEPSMMHAKTIIIDGTYCFIGSLNMDNVSLIYNFEGSIVAHDTNLANKLISIWNEDLKVSSLLTLGQHQNRPWYKKIITLIVSPIRTFL